jgi:hypothetical protein
VPDGLRGVVGIGGGSHVNLAVVAPLLDAHGSAGHLLLAWPGWAGDRRVEWIDDLTTAGSWVEAGDVPVRLGEGCLFTTRISEENRYYRLSE